jgi:hypothetical protein
MMVLLLKPQGVKLVCAMPAPRQMSQMWGCWAQPRLTSQKLKSKLENARAAAAAGRRRRRAA